jgi:hypothetical protein
VCMLSRRLLGGNPLRHFGGCIPAPKSAFICSAVTACPALRPSMAAKPEPTHNPGLSPRSV